MTSRILTVAAALLGAACATPRSGTATQAQQKPGGAGRQDDVICYTERPVGSNFPYQVCRSASQVEEDRQAAQDQIRLMQRQAGGQKIGP